ncbi:uncharacterized protein LOC130927828 isoform X2 [Corythoichthys intestinalis]|uniref:uncharacterized protein LOC130927828 isoform X2 n=1 Tax=Corythoichthys intestinalis TaxID=161448 RepID=UPI0025A67B35|nr:uncharacterized protein LOC130927828 isoform X2 [Corythoichthys intestinalis]
MAHNQYDPFSTLRRQTERDPHPSFSGERLGLSSYGGLSQVSDSDEISTLVHSYRERANTSQDIYSSKENDCGQDFLSSGVTARSSQKINRHSDEGDSSVSRLFDYGRTSSTAATSSHYSQPSISGGRSLLASEEDHNVSSIPRLPDGKPDTDQSSEPSQPIYTAELAADILLKFGLGHEDLEHLFSYPEDQVTPETLPFILQEIRIKKNRRVSNPNCSKPLREPPPDRAHASGDSWRSPGLAQKDTPSPLRQSSKVIDYRQVNKYASRMEEDVQGIAKRVEGDNLLTVDDLDRSCSQDLVQQVGRSANSSLNQQTSSSSLFSSILTSASPKSHNPVKPAAAIVKSVSPYFSLPKKEPDLRNIKSHTPKSSDSKQVQPLLKSLLKPQPQAPKPIRRSVHPSRPHLVVLGGDDMSSSCDLISNIAPASDNKSKTPQMPSQWQNIKEEQPQKEVYKQKLLEVKKTQQPPSKKTPQVSISANKQHLPANLQFVPMESQQFHPVPKTFPIPSILSVSPDPLCSPGLSSGVAQDLKPAQETVLPGFSTAVLMRDYSAATAKVFPHSCSLCHKECVHLKSVSKQTDSEAVAKTLAPAVSVELAKINPTSSEARPAEPSTAASAANEKPVVGKTTSDQQKLSSAKTESVKTSGPTIVTLKGILSSITYEDILTAVEVYGKIESVVLFHQKSQAIVCFEGKEDADKLRKERHIKIKGFLVSVQEEKEDVPSVQKHNPQRNPLSLTKVSKMQTSKSASGAPATQTKAETIPSKLKKKKAEFKRVDLVPTSGSDATLQTNSMPSCTSKAENPPTCVTDTSVKTKTAPSQNSRARLAKDGVLPKSSDVPPKAVVAAFDGAVTNDLLENCCADATMEEDESPSPYNSDLMLTLGERTCEFLLPHQIAVVGSLTNFRILKKMRRQLVFSNLPVEQDSYCVEDIIQLVKPFGFDSLADKMYVLPQSRMAFVELTHENGVVAAMDAWKTKKPTLKDTELVVCVLRDKVPMKMRGFYQWVMNWANFPVEEKCSKTIIIIGITLSETAILREALRKMDGVKNFLSLHNKVIVKFDSDIYADRIGVWYVLHDQCPSYRIYRLDNPRICDASQTFPPEAMPDLAFAGATVETCPFGVPELTLSPFYLTMRTSPYLFFTISPWFIIPEFLTVKNEDDIKEAMRRGASPTVMLTNLPEDSFKHEDVAKLAWPYFSQRDLRSLYYNVIVLPLQRRAFVHFSDWDACCRFVRCLLGNPNFRLKGYRVVPHFVLQPMCAQNSEENMYKSMMRLSNARIGEVESLAERLLCVEFTMSRKASIKCVLHWISMHAKIVNFLPLANRICIEMADSVGVVCVLEESKRFSVNFKKSSSEWKAIQRFESIESLNRRLQDPTVITWDLGEGNKGRSLEPVPPAAGEPTVGPVPTGAPSVYSEQPTKGLVSESQKVEMVAEEDCPKSESCQSVHDSELTLTKGEMMCKFLLPHKIAVLGLTDLKKNILKGKRRQLLIFNLPVEHDSYCIEDIIQLVKPFGFDLFADKIYVLPQSRMAFVELTTEKGVVAAMDAWKTNKPTLKDQKLEACVLSAEVPMWPRGFYHWVMRQMHLPVEERCPRTILIKGITLSETASLRKALRKIGVVNNFLPLHNKVFVEFESEISADRIGIWYTLHDQCPAYSIYRLNIPRGVSDIPQTFPPEAMPDLAFAGATVETCPFGIPELTLSPFYLTMRTSPYLFFTFSPWFIIPEFLTVKKEGDINEARRLGVSPTIMLTNLPEDSFKHEDVANLAWPYFSQKDLRSLYYNVIVLPLQRRAFVYFSDWDASCRFVRRHLGCEFKVRRNRLALHFVLQPMCAPNSEENMYKSMMQLSNSRISEMESLAERLLCVEITRSRNENIRLLLPLISRRAEVINFLPLANRICIEMANSAGVARVLEESKYFSMKIPKYQQLEWKDIQRFESIQSLNWRLQDPTLNTTLLKRFDALVENNNVDLCDQQPFDIGDFATINEFGDQEDSSGEAPSHSKRPPPDSIQNKTRASNESNNSKSSSPASSRTTRSSSRMSLSSGNVSSPVRECTRAQIQAKKSKDIFQGSPTQQTTTTCEEENLVIVLGDDHRPPSDEKLDVSKDSPTELQEVYKQGNISQVENADKEQIATVDVPTLEEQNESQRIKEMTKMISESHSAIEDVVEDKPSADLDSQFKEAEEDTTFSQHKDEEAETYQEIDSVEDQPASTGNEQKVSEVSKSQECKESPKKQERTTAKTPEHETCLVVDCVQANDSNNTPMSGRRRSTRVRTQEHTAKIFVQDSMEDDACITTRATRKRGRPPKKDTGSEEETVLTISPETAKKQAPIAKMEVVVIEEPTTEVLNQIKVSAPKRKGRKGSAKKDVKKIKREIKDTADDEEAAAAFEDLDSLKDKTSTGKMQSSLKKEDVINKMSPVRQEVEEEGKNQVVDSLAEDQTPDETSATEASGSGKTGEPQTEMGDKATRCGNKLEFDIREPSQTDAKTQQHSPQTLPHVRKDDTSPVTSALTLDQVGHIEEDILTWGIDKKSLTDHVTLDQMGHFEEDLLRCGIETEHQPYHVGISTSEDQKKAEEEASHNARLKDDENEESSQQKLDQRMEELVSPAVKRPRSESPFCPTAFVLPPYNPDHPLGTEFVCLESGFFCDLCSVFYLKESTAKEVHCRSRKHYNNLKKHYSMCEKDSSASTHL